MKCFFEEVTIVKPRSSRNSSLESFVVCRCFSVPDGFTLSMTALLDDTRSSRFSKLSKTSGATRMIVPFVTIGDLSGFDNSDDDDNHEKFESKS
jgi:tRNA (cytidine32/guanosine34-2'-O)-methyltransferase